MYSIGSCGLIWPMNLLTDEVLTVTTRDGGAGEAASLPSLLAGMARGEVAAFPAMRPHQRPAWHMFLVQLGALAMWTARQSDLPTQPGAWADMLRTLTPDHADDAPWRLVGLEATKPAFMQPPVPCGQNGKGLKWSPVETPDALDLLITSRNHDLKAAVAKNASAEDWMFALVSLQTTEGWGGRKKYGIARMNGGHSSRPMLRLAAAGERDLSIDPSASWARDVRRLLKDRTESPTVLLGNVGGPALLWCLAWPEGEQLELRKLDPWFIEVCRRVRLSQLAQSGTQLTARSSTSIAGRVDGKAFNGNVGDPWAPVAKRSGKSLTLAGRSFTYGLLHELLYSGNWQVPLLAQASAEDPSDLALVAEAISRGPNKTEGFKSRIVPVPRSVRRLFSSEMARELAAAQMEEINGVNKALKYAVARGAAHGAHESLTKGHYGFAKPATDRLDISADRLFFPSLWERVAAANRGESERHDAKVSFLRKLKDAGDAALEDALAAVPRRPVYKVRALVRARSAFADKLRSTSACRELFLGEDGNGSAS